MEGCRIFRVYVISFLMMVEAMLVLALKDIPTTLDGPSKPVTQRLDPSLRRGSDDLPMDHPRLKRNVTGIFPEQISLALSTPNSMWVSWITGKIFRMFSQINFVVASIFFSFYFMGLFRIG